MINQQPRLYVYMLKVMMVDFQKKGKCFHGRSPKKIVFVVCDEAQGFILPNLITYW